VRLPPLFMVRVPVIVCWTLLFWVKVPALFIVIDPPEVMLLVRVREVVLVPLPMVNVEKEILEEVVTAALSIVTSSEEVGILSLLQLAAVFHDPEAPPSQVTVAAKAGEGAKRKRNSIVIPAQAGIHLNKNLAGARTLLLCNRFRIKCGMTKKKPGMTRCFKFDKSLFIWYINFAG